MRGAAWPHLTVFMYFAFNFVFWIPILVITVKDGDGKTAVTA